MLGRLPTGMPGLLLVLIGSDRNRFCPEGATEGEGEEVVEGEDVAEVVEIGGCGTSGVGGIKAAGTAMVTYVNKFKVYSQYISVPKKIVNKKSSGMCSSIYFVLFYR